MKRLLLLAVLKRHMRSTSLPIAACLVAVAATFSPAIAQDLPVTDGLALWLKAGEGVFQDVACSVESSAADDSAYCWQDQSDNGLVLTRQQGSTPTFQPGVVNGQPTIRFNGSRGLGSATSDMLDFVNATTFVVQNAEAYGTALSIAEPNTVNNELLHFADHPLRGPSIVHHWVPGN